MMCPRQCGEESAMHLLRALEGMETSYEDISHIIVASEGNLLDIYRSCKRRVVGVLLVGDYVSELMTWENFYNLAVTCNPRVQRHS
jgi:hypothetical protein